ncbi:Uncharacterised protein [Candidatus Gugararchaeum adminiculabundum]|nr:Uncharacterised protein [Candidatus Gugararchaeum adminiculabundum]
MKCNVFLTMQSGQPPEFTWNYDSNCQKFWRMVEGQKVEVWQEGDSYAVTPGFEKLAQEMFRMHEDMDEIEREIHTNDEVMRSAVELNQGLRITKNDVWETVVCFVCSINSNLPAIRRNVQSLMNNGHVLSPLQILETDLETTKLGFRKRYIRAAANAALDGKFEGIGAMKYEDAKKELMKIDGIGPKVADCVLLFGYGFTEAFPTDVWILRAMKKFYNVNNEKEIGEFARKRWGKRAGHAQQYLYCLARTQLK